MAWSVNVALRWSVNKAQDVYHSPGFSWIHKIWFGQTYFTQDICSFEFKWSSNCWYYRCKTVESLASWVLFVIETEAHKLDRMRTQRHNKRWLRLFVFSSCLVCVLLFLFPMCSQRCSQCSQTQFYLLYFKQCNEVPGHIKDRKNLPLIHFRYTLRAETRTPDCTNCS